MSQDNSVSHRRPSPVAQVVFALMVVALLAGCGKKGNPIPPPGDPNTYPTVYPKN